MASDPQQPSILNVSGDSGYLCAHFKASKRILHYRQVRRPCMSLREYRPLTIAPEQTHIQKTCITRQSNPFIRVAFMSPPFITTNHFRRVLRRRTNLYIVERCGISRRNDSKSSAFRIAASLSSSASVSACDWQQRWLQDDSRLRQ